MLFIMSINAPVPWVIGALAGEAPPSAWNAMAIARVKIAIHLNIHGIRRDTRFQVIDVVQALRSFHLVGWLSCYAALGLSGLKA
jgi:hypothetical protein